jgi:TolB-like protein
VTTDSNHQQKEKTPSGLAAFWAELKRRKVMRVAITYVIVAWLIIQVAATTFGSFGIPEWAFRFVVILLCIFFPVAIILAWAFELTPEGIKTAKVAQEQTERTEDSKSHAKKRNWFSFMFGAAVPTLIFGTLAIFFYFRASPLVSPDQGGGGSPLGLIESDKSIAVLPLENLSPDPDNAFFADGVQEDILTNLSKIEELVVISRSSTLRYREREQSLKEIGAELDVRYVVEGSVRRAANRVLVTIQLIEVETDAHLWAESFNRPLDDIFAIQAEVAKTIAGELRAVISPESKALIEYRPTENQEAYDLFLKHKHLVDTMRRQRSEKAALLEQAVALDPAFAEA